MQTKDNNSSCTPAELQLLEESETFEILAPRPNSVKELSSIFVCCKNNKGIVLKVGMTKNYSMRTIWCAIDASNSQWQIKNVGAVLAKLVWHQPLLR